MQLLFTGMYVLPAVLKHHPRQAKIFKPFKNFSDTAKRQTVAFLSFLDFISSIKQLDRRVTYFLNINLHLLNMDISLM